MAALKALFSRPVVLLVAVIAVFALGYSMVRGSATGGAVAAASGGYTYDVPKGWDHRSPCHTIPLHQAGLADDGCTKPDLNADAGGYLMSMAVEPGRTGADVASALARSPTARACATRLTTTRRASCGYGCSRRSRSWCSACGPTVRPSFAAATWSGTTST